MTGPDVIVNFQGSVVGFTPRTDAAREWIEDNVQAEDYQWMGPTLWVDHRYAGPLCDGMAADGLELRA